MFALLDRFGGNRTDTLTILRRGGAPRPAHHIELPRTAVVHAQHRVWTEPRAAVEARLDALQERHPDNPFGLTYKAEIALWRGEYESAKEQFDAVWRKYQTRWGYIGRGACRALLEEYDECLAIYAEREPHGFLPEEATYAYRGEIYRRRGQWDKAASDLELAVRMRPNRVGAVLSLALLRVDQGRIDDARDLARTIVSSWPALVWEAYRSLGHAPAFTIPDELLGPLLARCLWSMRGNRSSYLLTFFDADGDWRLRPTPPSYLEEWRQRARRMARVAVFAQGWELLGVDPFES